MHRNTGSASPGGRANLEIEGFIVLVDERVLRHSTYLDRQRSYLGTEPYLGVKAGNDANDMPLDVKGVSMAAPRALDVAIELVATVMTSEEELCRTHGAQELSDLAAKPVAVRGECFSRR